VNTCETESRFLSTLGTLSFYLIAIIIGAQYGIFTELKYWVEDFYHHVAYIEQLKNNPFELGNPFFEGPPIYTLYYPYEYLISLVSNFSGLAPHESLALFGFINLSLLLFTIKNLSLKFNSSQLMPPLTLLLVLLFWPSQPLFFSSFYSLETIFFVASYPSTFAFMLSLNCILLAHTEYSTLPRKIAIAIIAALVILIHPITFMLLGVTLSSIWIARNRIPLKEISIPISLAFALLVAYFWPFFPLSELILGGTFSADPNGYSVYRSFLERYWPTLVALPIIFLRLRNNPRDFLSLSFFGLYAVYGFGYLLEIWNLGRSIAYIMFISQIIIADFIINFCSWYGKKCHCLLSPVYPTLILGILISKLSLVSWAWIQHTLQNKPTLYHDAKTIADQIKKGSTVIAPPDISLALPSFGVKVVVFNTPPFFGESCQLRNNDLKSFFSLGIPSLSRNELIKKYDASYVVIPNNHPVIEPLLESSSVEGVKYYNQEYVILTFNKNSF
jgi:hypothetical protein